MKNTRDVSLALLGALLLAACGGGGGTPSPRPSPSGTMYPVRGTLLSVAPDRKVVTIDHEEIPDFMDAMEMDFSVPDPAVLEGVEVGSYVEGDLVVDGRVMEITRLARVPGGKPSAAPASPPASASPAATASPSAAGSPAGGARPSAASPSPGK